MRMTVSLAVHHLLLLLVAETVGRTLGDRAEALAVDLLLDAVSGVPASLLGNLDVTQAPSAASLDAQLSLLAALQVAGDEERDEEVGQRSEIDDVEPRGEHDPTRGDAVGALVLSLVITGSRLLHLDRVRPPDEGVQRRNATANQKLGNLEGGDGALQSLGYADVHGSQGVVGVLSIMLAWVLGMYHIWRIDSYHDAVDERVEKAEDPDRSSHKADTAPHGEHSTGMVVGL